MLTYFLNQTPILLYPLVSKDEAQRIPGPDLRHRRLLQSKNRRGWFSELIFVWHPSTIDYSA